MTLIPTEDDRKKKKKKTWLVSYTFISNMWLIEPLIQVQ